MSAKQAYQLTYLAGKWVAGYRLPLDATTIDLTPDEAEYDLRAGTIVPPGQPLPTPAPPAVVEGSDVFGLIRAGGQRSASVADLVAYLVAAGAVASGQSAAIDAVLKAVRGSADPDHNTLGKLATIIAGLGVGDIAGLSTALAGKATPADIATARASLKAELLNGADAAHDTLGEIQALLQSDDAVLSGLLTAVGARLVATSNLSDLSDKAAARQALGVTDLLAGKLGTADDASKATVGLSDGTTIALSTVLASINSIAALRTLALPDAPRVTVRGYYAEGDGGGGVWRRAWTDTTSADDGVRTIVALDGTRWKLNQDGPIDLRQCGVRGNGADDTAAIRRAFSIPYIALMDVRGGRYRIDTTNGSIDPAKGVAFRGGGRLNSQFDVASADKVVFYLGETRQAMRSFGIVSSVTQLPGSIYIILSGAENTVEDYALGGHYHGVRCIGNVAVLADGRFLGIQPGGIGIDVGGGDNSQIIRGVLMGAEDNPNRALAGIRIRNSVALRVSGCDILQQGIAMLIDPYTSTQTPGVYDAGPVLNLVVDGGTHLDSSGPNGNLRIAPTGTGVVGRPRFLGSWTGSGAGDSIVIVATLPSQVSGAEFTNHESCANAGSGITTGGNGVGEILYNGGLLAQNGYAAYFGSGAPALRGVRVGPGGLFPANAHGVVFDAGVTRWIATGCDFTDQSGGLSDYSGSVPKVNANNMGLL